MPRKASRAMGRRARSPASATFKPGRSLATDLVFASIPGANSIFQTESRLPMPLLLLSDTVRHVVAGTAARVMAQAFIHPIDTVKTRLQVNKATATEALRHWRSQSKACPVDVIINGRRVVHMRNWLVAGCADIYLGLTGAVLGTIPTAFLYFSTYEFCKGRLAGPGRSDALTHLAAASAGAVVSAFVRVPTDTLKHRVQAYFLPDIFQGARTILAAEGIRGLYKGMVPTLLRDVPEIAIQFTLYERVRRVMEQRRGVTQLRTYEHLLLGGLCGAVAASVTMPLDFAKTVLQCGSHLPIRQVFLQTVREKGVGGLFAGMGPRVTQTAVMSAVFFTLFEFWKAQLKRDRKPHDMLLRPKIWRKRRSHVWKRQFVYQ